MKKMIIGLAILAITSCHALVNAQTCHTSAKAAKTHKVATITRRPQGLKLANTYQVCKEEGGYYTCCVHKNTSTAFLK